jgi:tetratricopeptide (TPR) repeat protein
MATNGLCFAATSVPSQKEQLLSRVQRELDEGQISNESSQDLEMLIEQDPRNARAHMLMGNALELLGLKEQALDQFKSAVRYAPNDPHALVELIKEYIKLGQMEQAKIAMDDARKRFPKDYEIMFWLGNFYLSRGQYSDAAHQYQAAYKSGKPIPGLASAMGQIALQRGKFGDAIAYADEDIRQKPKFPMANQIKGLALEHMGLYREALNPLKIAYDADPYKPDIAYAFAQSLYWVGYNTAAMRPALLYLAMRANLNNKDMRASRLVSDIMSQLSESYASVAISESSLRVPENLKAAYHFALADLLDQRHFRSLAITEYLNGLKIKPDFGKGWYALGLDYETGENNYAKALECYKKARLFAPEDKQIMNQERRLQDRLSGRNDDVAWQLKDEIKRLSTRK